ncbi:DUF5995 family protein [Nocardia huaxiensis]|uniref:Uncharacterized protein n=1 Tax=Nocardia huaxiensis TaxID=2755382 RepID=A0A7D6ZG93_9NOCA|nr:DUF5995 family protein [Nocardia huaxiensis]QLY30219.1 hypothetical protein H0264_34540 [Nocardia huaxiensis]UFS96163.1 DUF5995 family protein [Nocardia huaxiensis]
MDSLANAAPNPVVNTAVSPLSDSEKAELIQLSDPATLTDLHAGQDRIERIAQILVDHKDRRGIFAIFYRNILRDANPLLDAGNFDDPAWARRVSFAFFHSYLENLHGHLTGGAVTPSWQRYYDFAADPSRSAGRVAAAGLDAHLLIDFPQAVAQTGTQVRNTRDFFAIGDSLIGTTQHITDELSAIYGAELGDFFHLYFVGKAGDMVLGDGTTSYVMFQGVRSTSLTSGIAMENPVTGAPAEAGMYALYNTAETVFDGLEFTGLI